MLDSVSTLLMYFDVQTVFRFLHVFTRRIDTANAIGVVLIDSTAHDTQAVNRLLRLFDATLTVENSSTSNQPSDFSPPNNRSMSNVRWRFFLHLCLHGERRLTIPDPAEQIAVWETDKSVDRNDDAERQRVYTPLQQTDLRRLVDADLIDHENGTVDPKDRVTELDAHLDIVRGSSIARSEYYLGMSVMWVGSLGSVAIGFLLTAIRQPVGWAALVVGPFVISAAAYAHQSRQVHRNAFEERS